MSQKSTQGQLETSHTSTYHLCEILFNILQPGSISPECSLSLRCLKTMCHFLVSTLCYTKSLQFSLFFDFAKIFCLLLYFQLYFLSQFFSVSETRVKKIHGRRRNKEAKVSNTIMGQSNEYYRK